MRAFGAGPLQTVRCCDIFIRIIKDFDHLLVDSLFLRRWTRVASNMAQRLGNRGIGTASFGCEHRFASRGKTISKETLDPLLTSLQSFQSIKAKGKLRMAVVEMNNAQ